MPVFIIKKLISLRNVPKTKMFASQVKSMIAVATEGCNIREKYSLNVTPTCDSSSESEIRKPIEYALVTAKDAPLIPNRNNRSMRKKISNP